MILLRNQEFVDLAQKQLIFARIAKMMVLVSSVWNLTSLRMTELNVSSLSQTVLSVRVSTLQMEYLGFVLSVFRDITSIQSSMNAHNALLKTASLALKRTPAMSVKTIFS